MNVCFSHCFVGGVLWLVLAWSPRSPLAKDSQKDEQIAEAVYDVPIRAGLKWSPHPAFAKDAQGRYLYHHLKPSELGDKRSPFEFKQLATREVVAEDFVYALKRHASPRLEAPVAARPLEVWVSLPLATALGVPEPPVVVP